MGKKKPRRKQAKGTPQSFTTTRISNFVVPDTTIVKLRYKDGSLSRLNAGGTQFSVFTLRLNDVFDPDSAVGSGSVTGFSQWAAFYNNYRVRAVTIRWQLGNFTAVPIYAYMYPALANLVPATLNGAIDLAESSYATPVKLLAPAGSYPNIAKFQKRFNLAEVIGNVREYYSNPNYTGVASTSPGSPATRIFIQFVTYSNTAWSVNLTNDLEIDYEVEFFGRFPLSA